MDKTLIKIDKAVLHNTTDCIYDFTCLSGDKTCLCDVVASNEEDIVEVQSKLSISCKYCIALETSTYCHCPVRVKIYKHYKI